MERHQVHNCERADVLALVFDGLDFERNEMSLLNIKLIRIDGGTQSREAINEDVVEQYAEAVKDGAEFPAVRVYHDGNFYYLADGYHRYFAHLKAGRAGINADVINGTLRDAVLYSLGANALHGLQRTNADKRKSVTMMLEDFEWQSWSDREIARHCHVSFSLVADVRAEMGKDSETRKFKTLTGKVAERKVKKANKPEEKPQDVSQEYKDAHNEVIDGLQAENNELKDRLAVAALDATEEEKNLAEQTIKELREQVRILEIELIAVKKSRDQYQNENAQMKKQIAMLQKKLKSQEEV